MHEESLRGERFPLRREGFCPEVGGVLDCSISTDDGTFLKLSRPRPSSVGSDVNLIVRAWRAVLEFALYSMGSVVETKNVGRRGKGTLTEPSCRRRCHFQPSSGRPEATIATFHCIEMASGRVVDSVGDLRPVRTAQK